MALLIAGMIRFIANNLYGNGLLDFIGDILLKVAGILQAGTNGSAIASSYSIAQVYNLFVTVGTALLALYTIIDIYETISSSGEWTVEGITRSFAGFLIGYLVIANGMEILSGIVNIGNILLLKFLESDALSVDVFSETDLDMAMSAITAYLSRMGITGTIRAFFILIVPWGLVWIVKLVSAFFCVERILEIMARIALAPIALAGSFARGAFSHGIQYLKKLATLAIQGALVIIIVWAGSSITATLANNGSSLLGGFGETIASVGPAIESQYPGQGLLSLYLSAYTGIFDAISTKVIGEDKTETILDGAASIFHLDYDEDEGVMLDSIASAGRKALFGDEDTGTSGMLTMSSLLFICAVQVGMLWSIVKSQSIAADVIG